MSGGRCPVCGKLPLAAYRPFCSKRCADVDLQRWLAGVHRVSSDEDPQSENGDDDRDAYRPPEED